MLDDGSYDEIKGDTRTQDSNGNYSEGEFPYNETKENTSNSALRHSNDAINAADDDGRSRGMNGNIDLKVNKKQKGGLYSSPIISGLMDQYLNNDYGYSDAPPIKPKPRRLSEDKNLDELENNLKNLEITNKKKQAPPPVRHKPPPGHKTWNDPRDQQRPKVKEKHWPPR